MRDLRSEKQRGSAPAFDGLQKRKERGTTSTFTEFTPNQRTTPTCDGRTATLSTPTRRSCEVSTSSLALCKHAPSASQTRSLTNACLPRAFAAHKYGWARSGMNEAEWWKCNWTAFARCLQRDHLGLEVEVDNRVHTAQYFSPCSLSHAFCLQDRPPNPAATYESSIDEISIDESSIDGCAAVHGRQLHSRSIEVRAYLTPNGSSERRECKHARLAEGRDGGSNMPIFHSRCWPVM